MPEPGPPEVLDQDGLFSVVPEQFIAARDALVKARRAAGDKAGAAEVAKLRRPPLTVWVLNQVARATPAVIEALLGAGRGLRSAMERALDGDASGLRHARDEERAAVGAVVSAAERRLSESGYAVTDTIRQRLAATLRAAIVDESVAAGLLRGALDKDHDVPGFGMDALAAPLTLLRSPPGPGGARARRGDVAPASGGEVAPASGGEVAPASGGEVAPASGGEVAPASGGEVAPASGGEVAPGAGDHPAPEQARQLHAARQEADRLAAEADRLAGEADRLAAEADRRAGEAEQLAAEAERAATHAREAGQRAAEARDRAVAAQEAATAKRAEVDRRSP